MTQMAFYQSVAHSVDSMAFWFFIFVLAFICKRFHADD